MYCLTIHAHKTDVTDFFHVTTVSGVVTTLHAIQPKSDNSTGYIYTCIYIIHTQFLKSSAMHIM